MAYSVCKINIETNATKPCCYFNTVVDLCCHLLVTSQKETLLNMSEYKQITNKHLNIRTHDFNTNKLWRLWRNWRVLTPIMSNKALLQCISNYLFVRFLNTSHKPCLCSLLVKWQYLCSQILLAGKPFKKQTLHLPWFKEELGCVPEVTSFPNVRRRDARFKRRRWWQCPVQRSIFVLLF